MPNNFCLEHDSDSDRDRDTSDFELACQLNQDCPHTKVDPYISHRPDMSSDTDQIDDGGPQNSHSLPSLPNPLPQPTMPNSEAATQNDAVSSGLAPSSEDQQTVVVTPPASPITPASLSDHFQRGEQNDTKILLPTVPRIECPSADEVLMSGVVALQDEVVGELGNMEDDNIHCHYTNACKLMPYKVVRLPELLRWNLGPENNARLQTLPHDFVTTHLGIRHSLFDWQHYKTSLEEQGEVMDWSVEFLNEIRARGGLSNGRNNDVVYPEDIIPLEHFEERNGRFYYNADDIELHDEEYWRELEAQGEVWDGMPEITTFSAGTLG